MKLTIQITKAELEAYADLLNIVDTALEMHITGVKLGMKKQLLIAMGNTVTEEVNEFTIVTINNSGITINFEIPQEMTIEFYSIYGSIVEDTADTVAAMVKTAKALSERNMARLERLQGVLNV